MSDIIVRSSPNNYNVWQGYFIFFLGRRSSKRSFNVIVMNKIITDLIVAIKCLFFLCHNMALDINNKQNMMENKL